MVIGRLLGWIAILAAVAVTAADLLGNGEFEPATVGRVWRTLHFDSMVGLQFLLQDAAPWALGPGDRNRLALAGGCGIRRAWRGAGDPVPAPVNGYCCLTSVL